MMAEETGEEVGRARKPRKRAVKNLRPGVVNISGRLAIRPGESVELTSEHLADKRLMAKIERGIETGVLAEG